MPIIWSLPSENSSFIEWPKDLVGWAIWFFLLGLVAFTVIRSRRHHPVWGNQLTLIFLVLLSAVPVCAFLLGVRLPAGDALPLPSMPFQSPGAALMLLAAIPWLLSAGILGPLPTALLAGFSGLLLALFDDHSAFTPLSYALVGALVSISLRQRYRTKMFRLLSHPLVAAGMIALLYPLLYVSTVILTLDDDLPVRLDFALSHVDGVALAFLGSALVGGIAAQFVSLVWPARWGNTTPFEPSPAERSIEARLLYNMAPLAVGLLLILLVGDWWIAERVATEMIRNQMVTTAEAAGSSLPFALETGQNQILQLARDDRLTDVSNPETLQSNLQEMLGEAAYFHQLSLFAPTGEMLAGYPISSPASLLLSPDELLGLELAGENLIPFQMYTILPPEPDIAGWLSFIVAIPNSDGGVESALLGRSRISANPFTQPILNSLQSIAEMGGQGLLVDDQGVIVYHPQAEAIGGFYTGQASVVPDFTDDPAPDGTRQLVYYYPVAGRSWSVVVNVPAQVAQQVAMNVAVPLLVLGLSMAGVAFLVLRVGVRFVVKPLQQLTRESSHIAQGDLDHSLVVSAADEVGKLGESLEKMRISLKTRLEETDRILFVTQGVASAMEVETAVIPILEGALATGAASARMVLAESALPEFEQQDLKTRFGLGPSTEKYAHLDAQILGLSERQRQIVLENPTRARLDNANPDNIPGALMALALRHEDAHYGVLWVAYDQSHRFDEEEIRFITTVAGQAALAASNARLYLTAEIGRQRLEAILSSTPDPVLVTDHRGQLLLANPAAADLLSNGSDPAPGAPIRELVKQEKLLELLLGTQETSKAVEVVFPNNRVFYATASSVMAEGQLMGRVCVLSDVTHFKEIDALKSEFVATVSHDLRSPLTLMRGYATMLQMVGELNEQQSGYVNKIVTGVESMSRLVNNLLDLGRIEAGVGLQLEMVPITDVVRQVTDALQLHATQKNIDLVVHPVEHTMPLVEADGALINQAIHNLIENAIKYTPSDGRVDVLMTLRKEQFEIAVKDTGLGISAVDQQRLFERFYRAAGRQAREQRGSGLGLAIVKSIAERHYGSVQVESKLGEGSAFYLVLPLRQPKAEE